VTLNDIDGDRLIYGTYPALYGVGSSVLLLLEIVSTCLVLGQMTQERIIMFNIRIIGIMFLINCIHQSASSLIHWKLMQLYQHPPYLPSAPSVTTI
jgi:hypothetical protein